MKRVPAVAVAVAAVLLAGACGQDGEPAGPTTTRPTAASPPTTRPTAASPATARPTEAGPTLASPAPATPPPSLRPAPDRTVGPAEPVTVTGTVEEGVEPGCLVLDGYLLLGGRDRGIRAGAKVIVTGRIQRDLVTTCQQGTPLRVETVRPG